MDICTSPFPEQAYKDPQAVFRPICFPYTWTDHNGLLFLLFSFFKKHLKFLILYISLECSTQPEWNLFWFNTLQKILFLNLLFEIYTTLKEKKF